MPKARAILQFARLSYAQPSRHSCVDEEGHRRTEGDPLMLILFSMGIQQALEEVAAAILPGEQLSVFLDDVFMFCPPDRVGPLHKLLDEALLRNAGMEERIEKERDLWRSIPTL